MSDSSEKPRLIIVRRVGEGPGGAAKTLRRFESLFADEWTTEILSAGGADGRVPEDPAGGATCVSPKPPTPNYPTRAPISSSPSSEACALTSTAQPTASTRAGSKSHTKIHSNG